MLSNQNPSIEKDKNLLHRIQRGDPAAWSEFVSRFTDWVFYIANSWTSKDSMHTGNRDKRSIQHHDRAKSYTYTDEGLDAYLWIMDQLRKKLKSFTGRKGATLSTYVWAVLHSNHLLVDYLRWKHGDTRKLPNALITEDKQTRDIFLLLRKHKTIEQIASKNKISVEKAQYKIQEVIGICIRLGLDHYILPPRHVTLDEIQIDTQEVSFENKLYLRELQLHLYKVVKTLKSEEQTLLRLLYDLNMRPNEIVEHYRSVGKSLPGSNLENLPDDPGIRFALNRILKKLKDSFSNFNTIHGIAGFNEKIILRMLEEFGTDFQE